MKAELVAHLRRAMRGDAVAKKGVTAVTPVTGPLRLRLKAQALQRLHRLRLANDDTEKVTTEGVTASVTASASDLDAVEERAALAADSVPACYLDAWARLQIQRPLLATERNWRRAIDDAGRFLDAWSADAAAMQWRADELFDVPRGGRPGGLVWQLKGQRVDALGEHRARLADGRTIKRGAR